MSWHRTCGLVPTLAQCPLRKGATCVTSLSITSACVNAVSGGCSWAFFACHSRHLSGTHRCDRNAPRPRGRPSEGRLTRWHSPFRAVPCAKRPSLRAENMSLRAASRLFAAASISPTNAARVVLSRGANPAALVSVSSAEPLFLQVRGLEAAPCHKTNHSTPHIRLKSVYPPTRWRHLL